MKKKLAYRQIENYSGVEPKLTSLPKIKKNQYIILDESVTGDAPKDILRLYLYGEAKRNEERLWKKYITKLGHKWYPIESVTEHLITRIGQHFGFNIANSHIVYIQDKVRFLSEHFHTKKQQLVHGAEILSNYLNERDTEFVDDIERIKKTKEVFDIDDLIAALKYVYPNNQKIIDGFIGINIFDALIGNNDRHFYNWGIIQHIEGAHEPYFSPIYDTARGLWWNTNEENILSLHRNPSHHQPKFDKYIYKNSLPKVGFKGHGDCNHFELVKYLDENKLISVQNRLLLSDVKVLDYCLRKIKKEFSELISLERMAMIEKVLRLRFSEIYTILHKQK